MSSAFLDNSPNLRSMQFAAVMIAATSISIGGSSGCRSQSAPPQAKDQQDAAEETKKRKTAEQEEKKKTDYEIGAAVPQPADGQALLAKPGHWMTAAQSMMANYGDFVGETTLRALDKERRPLAVPNTPYTLSATRPVALAKGRAKHIDSTIYVPPAEEQVWLQATLRERNSSRRIPAESKLTLMPSYQYFVVVLAKEPARYTFLKTLHSFKAPVDTEDTSDDTVHYQVLLPDISRRVPLPESSLCWTSMAYIVWDEVDPQQLSETQRTALVDWIHWGGQLLISGPDSLDLLKGSFLADYLPADSEGARAIENADLGALNEKWTRPGAKNLSPNSRTPSPNPSPADGGGRFGIGAKPLAAGRPWSGVRLRPRPKEEIQIVPDTGELIVERRVGRGRIVVSAFQLAERDFLAWGPSLDQFTNAVLLRRPARVFSLGPYEELHLDWNGRPERRLDAALTSQLRYFTRDTHDDPGATNFHTVEVKPDATPLGIAPAAVAGSVQSKTQPPLLAGGVGSWNDISAPAVAASTALREAAGVKVPNGMFVLGCLGAYLLVLVPLNWAVFQAIGRVELAWVAAPIIALAGTWVVVRQAQLDIGYVRAQTEVAVLELQPNYRRGHLTRFTGLYTSLSTTYELAYDDPTAVAAPFPSGELLPGQSLVDVDFSQQDMVRLSNLEVSSATTRMVHSEEMMPDVPIKLGKSSQGFEQIENQSELHLRSVAILRRGNDREELKGCWIGELRPRSSAIVSDEEIDMSDGVAFFEDRADEMKGLPEDALNLEPLFKVACDPRHLEPGEVRLVAKVDEILPGSTVTPAASQAQGATLVVVHLRYGPLEPPEPDVNSPLDVLSQK